MKHRVNRFSVTAAGGLRHCDLNDLCWTAVESESNRILVNTTLTSRY